MPELATCPACGDRLEATLKLYLSEVRLDAETGQLLTFDVHSEAIGAELSLYCGNDHSDIETAVIKPGTENEILFPHTIDLYGHHIRLD